MNTISFIKGTEAFYYIITRELKVLEGTFDRRNELISNEDYKKAPKSKRIKQRIK